LDIVPGEPLRWGS